MRGLWLIGRLNVVIACYYKLCGSDFHAACVLHFFYRPKHACVCVCVCVCVHIVQHCNIQREFLCMNYGSEVIELWPFVLSHANAPWTRTQCRSDSCADRHTCMCAHIAVCVADIVFFLAHRRLHLQLFCLRRVRCAFRFLLHMTSTWKFMHILCIYGTFHVSASPLLAF